MLDFLLMFHWELLMLVTYYMDYMAYMLLTKSEVKMAGYWQGSFFCIFKDWDKIGVHKDAQEVMRLISSHLDQPSLVTSFFCCTGSKWAIVREKDDPIWLSWVANQNTGLASYCPRGAFSNILSQLLIVAFCILYWQKWGWLARERGSNGKTETTKNSFTKE